MYLYDIADAADIPCKEKVIRRRYGQFSVLSLRLWCVGNFLCEYLAFCKESGHKNSVDLLWA